MKKELIFASFGLYAEQITLETITALRQCDKVYLTCARRAEEKLLFTLFPKAELIGGLPLEALKLKVMETFLKHDRVGVLDYGDPSFLCFFSEGLRKACLKNKVGFRKCQAISSVNALIADLGLGRLGPGGLYLVTAHEWEVASRVINTAVPLLLFSLDRVRLDARRRSILVRVVKDIQRVYPPGHEVYFIRCRQAYSGKRRKRKVTVARLGKSFSGLTFDTTLYVPAVAVKRGLKDN